MSPEEAISGARVRVIGSPERTGSIISDEPREQNGIWSVRILFDDGIRRMLRLDHLEAHPNTKVVLFAFFKPTLRYLEDRLKRDGISSHMPTGDQSGDKQEIVDEFAKPDSAPILLSSEVGSEGLDLQLAG